MARLPADKTRQLRELPGDHARPGQAPNEVETGLRSCPKDFPKEQDYQFQLAQFYASQGRVDEADALLRKVTELDPKNADTQLGVRAVPGGPGATVEKAEAALKTFVEENPDAGKLRSALGQLYETTERREEARKVYEELGKRDPKSVEGLAARNRVAAIDIRAGKLEDGRATIDADPRRRARRLRCAAAPLGTALSEQAVRRRHRRPAHRPPQGARATTGRCCCSRASLRPPERASCSRRTPTAGCWRSAPDSPDGLQQLAVLYAGNKDFVEAEALLRKRLESSLTTWWPPGASWKC